MFAKNKSDEYIDQLLHAYKNFTNAVRMSRVKEINLRPLQQGERNQKVRLASRHPFQSGDIIRKISNYFRFPVDL